MRCCYNNKIKHPHNPWVNHFVNEYCTRFIILGECDCFLFDSNIIWWFNEFNLWINTNNKIKWVNK
jgi:hypothetical protein